MTNEERDKMMEERITMLRLKHGNENAEVKAWDEAHGGPPTDVDTATQELDEAKARTKAAEDALDEARKIEAETAQKLDAAKVEEVKDTDQVIVPAEKSLDVKPPVGVQESSRPPGPSEKRPGSN